MCVFCERDTVTRLHHVVPKSKGGKITVPTCEACESFIHRTFTHRQTPRVVPHGRGNAGRPAVPAVQKLAAQTTAPRGLSIRPQADPHFNLVCAIARQCAGLAVAGMFPEGRSASASLPAPDSVSLVLTHVWPERDDLLQGLVQLLVAVAAQIVAINNGLPEAIDQPRLAQAEHQALVALALAVME